MTALILALALPSGEAQAQPAAFQAIERRAAARPQPFRDYSSEGLAAEAARGRSLLSELDKVDRAALPHPDQVTYDVIRWDAERIVERAAYPWLQFPYTAYEFRFGGPNRVLAGFSFRSAADVDSYLKLAAAYPASVDTMTRFVGEQSAHGVRVQRDVAAKVKDLIGAQAQPAEQSFAWPDDGRLAALPPGQVRRLRAALRPLIEQGANPALRRLSEAFGEPYQAAAPTGYGLAQYPGGRDYYRVLVRHRLGLELSPERLFDESQAALDRIESELEALRAEMGDTGGRAAFDARLAADPKFRARTPAEVEKTYLDYMGRIDPLMGRLFCRPAPYGYAVARAAPDVEAALTFGYAGEEERPARRGMYYYNGSHLDQRSLLPAQALIYHELAPGHYWQGAMAWLTPPASPYRRSNAAFAEAWGDFAQHLAYEQGVFRTPQERYGRRLFNAMFHARALADIGVNYFGKDFDWGMAVLRRYTFESELQNRSSLTRDTTDWPAQILPYSFGSQALLRLREKARFELAERFSAPRFYDAVLSPGELALPVLERHVEWFIAQEKTGRAPGICGD